MHNSTKASQAQETAEADDWHSMQKVQRLKAARMEQERIREEEI